MKSRLTCVLGVNGLLLQNNFATDKLLRALSSCFIEVIFTEPKKDRHRERLGYRQCYSCFPTSPPSLSLNAANSHPDSSGVCIFQSTPSTLCLEPGFLRNEFLSQRVDSSVQSALIFCLGTQLACGSQPPLKVGMAT